jgi:hypothetical protein
MSQPWEGETCSICGGPFTEQEWADRHTAPEDGMSDCHAQCCPLADCMEAFRMTA